MMVVLLFVTLAMGSAYGQQKKFDNVTITIQVDAAHKQMMPVWERLDEFEKQTGIKVNLVKLPWADLMARVMRNFRLGAGEFDAVEVCETMITNVAPYVVPIEDFLKKDGVDVEKWKEQWYEFAIETSSLGGPKVLFQPWYANMEVGSYRRDLFESPQEKTAFKKQFGYELGPPKTIEQLLDIAKFFTRDSDGDGKTDLWGLIVAGKWNTGCTVFENQVFGAGLRQLDENFRSMWGPQHPENWETVIDIARFDQNLIQKWKVSPPEVLGMETRETLELYLQGRGAMIIGWLNYGWKDFMSPGVVERIGRVASFRIPPRKPGMGGFAGSWMFGISKDSKNKEATWEFLKWYTSEENLNLALEKGLGSYLPTRIASAERGVSRNLVAPGLVESAKFGRLWRNVANLEHSRDIVRGYHEKLLMGNITPEDFVKKTGAEIDQMMVEAGIAK